MTVSYHLSRKKRELSRQRKSRSEHAAGEENREYLQATPFFSMLENFQRGTLPHNDELKSWLAAVRSSGLFASSGLSDTGKKVMKDLEELFVLLQRAIDTKNRDELFQQFLYHARLAARIAADDLTRTGKIKVMDKRGNKLYLGGSREHLIQKDIRAVRKSAQGNAKSLYSVLQLLVTSPMFREVIADVQQLVRKALVDPQPSVIAMPIMTDTFFKPSPDPYTPEHPRSSIAELKRRVAITSRELESLKIDVRTPDERFPISTDRQSVETETKMLNAEHSIRPTSTSISAIELEQAEGLPIVNKQQIGISTAHSPDSAPTRVPTPESPRRAEDRDAKSENIKTDDIEGLIDDLRGLILKFNSNPDLKTAVRQIYRFAMNIQQVPAAVRKESVLPRELRYEANFQQAQRDLLHVLERFANNTSLDPAIRAVQNIGNEAARDYKLKDFVGDWSSYLVRSMQDSSYVDHAEFRSRGRFLFERTREFHNAKYRPMFDDAFNSLRDFTDGWTRDELTTQIGRSINRIFVQDLVGQPDMSDRAPGLLILNLIKPELFNDFRNVILPNVLRQLHVIPLPRIEAVYGGSKFVLEDLVLPGDAFLPMDFELKAKTSLKMHPKARLFGQSLATEADKGWKNGLILRVNDIKTTVRDVRFTLDQPDVFPRIQDSGLADIHIGGKHGMNIMVNVLSDARDIVVQEEKRPKLYPHYVRVSIDKLRVRLHHSSRDTTYMLLAPLINYALKRAIETAIRDRIVASVFSLDDLIRRVTRSQ